MHIDRRARLSALDDATTLVHRDPEPLKTFDVPILIIDGDDDQILPIDDSARLSAKLVRGVNPGFGHGTR